jgi:hypothetical protein
MEDGREGWSAEAPLNFPNYFLEPAPKQESPQLAVFFC